MKNTKKKTKRKGREARHKITNNVIAPKSRKIPVYEILDEKEIIEIEKQADWILEKIGIEFVNDEIALEMFKNAGAKIEKKRVTFEPGLARDICQSAPEEFILNARNKKNNVTLGGNNIVLMPGYGSPFVTDLENGRRYATFEDFENFIKLSYQSPWLKHSSGTIVEPTDIPVNKRHLDMMLAHLTLSDKPFMGSVTHPQRAKDSIEMCEIVFGEFVNNNAVIQANINVNSPLIYDETMSHTLRIYAQAGQCVCVSPAIFAGAMGPLAPSAVIAQTLAEAMVGIALTQLVKPKCPVVFGSFHSTINLKSGALTFGSPEANLVTMGLAQIGRRLKVPVRSGGGQITSANYPDGQAMQDSANAMWATLISGTNQVWHAAGWLEGGLVMSYEKFVMDLDNCGAMLKMLQGINVDENALAKDAYSETGPGTNFLQTQNTLKNYKTANFETQIDEAGPFEAWYENGELNAEQRATKKWKENIETYKKPEIDSDVEKKLKKFVAEKKNSMQDEWY